MRRTFLILLLLVTGTAQAQQSQSPDQPPVNLHTDSPSEVEKLRDSCFSTNVKSLGSCAEELFTGKPVHIAVGIIAPRNRFGLGLAYIGHKTPNEAWRISWSADAAASNIASWRAGAYLKLVHTPIEHIRPVSGKGPPPKSRLAVHEYTVFNLYAQSISLNKIYFFGLGPHTVSADRSFFGMGETIVGANAIKPVFRALNVSLIGELNGRFVDVRGSHNQPSPSIEQIYTEATAPGLTTQPGFVQFGEGIRIRPSFFSDHVQLNYLINFQQFVAPSHSAFSFARFTADLSHVFPLYRTTRSMFPRDFNTPDECSQGLGGKCPAISRNREGSIGIRLLISESMAPATHVVPFYFQPTLGGSDLNGEPSLASYQDYRFRAPNLLLLRESLEHSIYGPLGFTFQIDEGKVAFTRGEIGFNHLAHSFSTGLTLRAGGFPEVWLLFAWGGKEGTHTIANVSTALLGGSPRPSLY
jgi:hypothetical protein